MEQKQLKALLADMSLEEKIGQLVQISGSYYQEDVESFVSGPDNNLGLTAENVRLAGSILSTYGAKELKEIQKNYMEQHPHHIPMLFMMDVIHGMKTIFPMPLALGATFDPKLVGVCAEAAAKEAAASGLHVTFAPMVDLVRDARWGRVMESTGEDPYLNSLIAAEQVRGFQGEDMSAPGKVCACIKHFAGYGGAVAGRDYNTVELCEHTFRDFYLKAYKSGIDAGAGMVMTSFNTINGIPASVNKWLMRDVLREELGFDGVLISDYAAIAETIAHGCSADSKDAAKKGIQTGVDIDMMTTVYAANLAELVREGSISEALIDECAWRVLELKNRLGLFENPYKDADEKLQNQLFLCKEHRDLARETAQKSFVLLKNDGVLPVDTKQKIAFIGPYTDYKNMISSWAMAGEAKDCVTIREAAEELPEFAQAVYLEGSPILMPEREYMGFAETSVMPTSAEEAARMCAEAVEAAKEADLVIMPLGEHYLQSGEAASRAMIDIPEVQMELFREVTRVNENVVVVLFTGRPLDIREVSKKAKAVLNVWLPGTEGGHAIMDVLTGRANPSGKLPMSFPYSVGQVPVSYNAYSTGRPGQPGKKTRYESNYLDIPNAPLYPFGYGLSYTAFEMTKPELSTPEMTADRVITAKTLVTNTGSVTGVQTVQLYIQDVTASVVRPVKELKGIQKAELAPGESREVTFEITEEMLQFLRADGTVGSEAGEFRVWIAGSSAEGEYETFWLK